MNKDYNTEILICKAIQIIATQQLLKAAKQQINKVSSEFNANAEEKNMTK